MAPDPIGARCKEVRLATGLKQADFAGLLSRAAKQLHGGAATGYDQPLVSLIENGGRDITLEDVAVYAAVDPMRRGKLWLGWGESRDPATAETPEELAARLGVEPPRRGPQFPAPAAAKKATQAGGQKRRPGR